MSSPSGSLSPLPERHPRGWRQLWQRPEALMSEVGFGGEALVAGLRLLVLVLFLYLPANALLRSWRSGHPIEDLRVLLLGAALTLGMALLIYSAVARDRGRSWIGFASGLLDVSMVTGLLAFDLLLPDDAGRLLTDSWSPVIFPAYFIAIGATSLRYDPRVCLVTGSLAVVQYGVLVAVLRLGLPAMGLAPAEASLGPAFWPVQVARLVALGAATALAVAVVLRVRLLRTLSSRDRFTGLLNRATFDERLRVETELAAATGTPLAVAMVDIDRFKLFNDTYGHAGGDQALQQVAGLLLRSFREGDAVARYGGEEFSLLLPQVRADQCQVLFERIRGAVAGLEIPGVGFARPAAVTVSIGVALYPDDGATAEEVLAEADRRLYQAKQGGRNRVVGPGTERAAPEAAAPAVGTEGGGDPAAVEGRGLERSAAAG